MKRCDCAHWEICPTCFPQGFDEDGNIKPAERPPTRAELMKKVTNLEAENKRLKTDLSNCDGELAHYQATIAQQAEENARLLQANRDCVDYFEVLKVDFDKQAERIKKPEQRINENAMPDDYIQMADEITDLKAKLAAAEKALRQIAFGEAENGCIISIGDCIEISNEALAAIAEGEMK